MLISNLILFLQRKKYSRIWILINRQMLCPAIPVSQLKNRERWQLYITLVFIGAVCFLIGELYPALHFWKYPEFFSPCCCNWGNFKPWLPGLSLFWPGDGDRDWNCWATPEQYRKKPQKPVKQEKKKIKEKNNSLICPISVNKLSVGLCHSSASLAVQRKCGRVPQPQLNDPLSHGTN